MQKIKVMVNGLPGNVAQTVTRFVINDERFELIPCSLTGPGVEERFFSVNGVEVELLTPEIRDKAIEKWAGSSFIAIDYTHPTAVNGNAQFYSDHKIPFVMGTTGGDRDLLMNTVKESSTISAVIAPNMAKQIVGFQAMMEYAAKTFPGLFEGYSLKLEESHQSGKADTSGTAKAMIEYFNQLGIPFSADEIHMERDPESQKNKWGIPEEHIGGHAWHTYTLTSPDGTAGFTFKHNINGRDIYVQGTLDGVCFLKSKTDKGSTGEIFSMIDVMKGA